MGINFANVNAEWILIIYETYMYLVESNVYLDLGSWMKKIVSVVVCIKIKRIYCGFYIKETRCPSSI